MVVANPPYMGAKNMNRWLGDWVKQNYPDVKGDLFSCFMVRNSDLGNDYAQMGFMTPYVWMFISTYEKLRKFVIKKNTITSLIQLEYSGFAGATVPICTFTLQKGCLPGYQGSYIRLSDFVGADQQAPRALEALANPDCGWLYQMQSVSFSTIPGNPISYWVTEGEINAFTNGRPASDVVDFAQGLKPGDTERFIRAWYEVSSNSIYDLSAIPADSDYQSYTWFRISNGGEYRKWYGNLNDVVNWHNQGYEIRNFKDDKGKCRARVQNERFYFKEGLTWSALTSGPISVRVNEHGIMCAGAGYFINANDDYLKIMGFLNSSTSAQIKKLLTESLNNEVGDLSRFPILMNEDMATRIERIVSSCVDLCRKDWDSFETSSSFSVNPLI